MFNKQTQQGSARAAPRPPKPGVKSASDVLGPPRSRLCDGEVEASATSLGLSGGSQSQRGAAKQGVKGLCPSVPGPAVSPAQEGWEEGLRCHASTTTYMLDPGGPSARLSEAGTVSPTRETVEANPRVQTKGWKPEPEPCTRTERKVLDGWSKMWNPKAPSNQNQQISSNHIRSR